ncbi:MAG: cysteine desulfurase family protein [Bacteroidales bacterium]|jgi:cysteine desulfurase
MNRVYLDNASSTPIDPRVLETITVVSKECYANASSMHSDGTRAKEILEDSRERLASVLNCNPEEVFFTSGGTEANNWALKGFAFANRHKGKHIIISGIEHDCVLNSCSWLQDQGFNITMLPVDESGITDPEALRKAIKPETILVSVMHVNNELGTIQPVNEIGRITRETNVTFHVDACQSFGKIPIDTKAIQADMISVNAHKIYGPKGTAALYIKNGTVIEPLLHGGGHERGLRSTTENIPSIAGFSRAAELSNELLKEEQIRIGQLCLKLKSRLSEEFDNVYFNGSQEYRVPGLINFAFSGQEGQAMRLLLMLDDEHISVSTGSACSSNHPDSGGSHVLKAIGRDPVKARGAIRISIGRFNSENDIDQFCDALSGIMKNLNQF